MSYLYAYRDEAWLVQGIEAVTTLGHELSNRGLNHTVINTAFGTFTTENQDDYRQLWLAYLRKDPLNPAQQRMMTELMRDVSR